MRGKGGEGEERARKKVQRYQRVKSLSIVKVIKALARGLTEKIFSSVFSIKKTFFRLFKACRLLSSVSDNRFLLSCFSYDWLNRFSMLDFCLRCCRSLTSLHYALKTLKTSSQSGWYKLNNGCLTVSDNTNFYLTSKYWLNHQSQTVEGKSAQAECSAFKFFESECVNFCKQIHRLIFTNKFLYSYLRFFFRYMAMVRRQWLLKLQRRLDEVCVIKLLIGRRSL